MHDWTVVIPVYFEKKIQECIDNISQVSQGYNIQIILSCADTGWTEKRLLRYTDNLLIIHSGKGRGVQISAGIKAASADKIVVLHADCRLPLQAFYYMDQMLKKKEAGAFLLKMRTKNPLLVLSTINVNIRCLITRIPFGDHAHFFKKQCAASVGGYPEIPLFEDVDFMERLKKIKISIGFLLRYVTTSDRRYASMGYWKTTFRNWKLEYLWKKNAPPEQLASQYYKDVTTHNSKESKAIVVFHRSLKDGNFKTRIKKVIGDHAVKDIYKAFLADIERELLSTDAALLPFVDNSDDRDLLFWNTAETQKGKDIGHRMADAFQRVIEKKYEKILLIGSDTPQLKAEVFEHAFTMLSSSDIVFGPASDGGYYLIGCNAKSFTKDIFSLTKWSHENVLSESISLCHKNNKTYQLLETETDFDTVEDIESWYIKKQSRNQAPNTRQTWKKIRKYI